MNLAISLYQHDLIKIPSFVRYVRRLAVYIGLQTKQIEVPDFMAKILWYPIEFSFIKLRQRLHFIHQLIYEIHQHESYCIQTGCFVRISN